MSAAEVPGTGAQPVFEAAVWEQAPCGPVSVEVPPASAVVLSGEKRPGGLRVWLERRVVPEGAGEWQQHGWVQLVREPVSAGPA